MSDPIRELIEGLPRKQELARYTPLPSVAMVCRETGGRVLMARRADTNEMCPGFLQFSGGMIEIGETIEQAARREFKEETGIVDVEYRGVLSVDSYCTEETGHWVCTFILFEYGSLDIPPNPEPHKSKNWLWLFPRNLEPPHMHGMPEALARMQERYQ